MSTVEDGDDDEDYEDIPREEIHFAPLAEEIVRAFDAVHERHCPTDKLRFVHCGNCERLHVFASEESGVGLDIAPDMWERMSRQ